MRWRYGMTAAILLAALGLLAVPATAGMPISDVEDRFEGTAQFVNQTLALTLGDFDGDGMDDLASSVKLFSTENGVGVVRGKAGGYGHVEIDQNTAAVSFGSPTINDEMGTSLGAGDVDGDGRDDLLIGAPGGAVIQGEVMLLFGKDFPAAWEQQVDADGYHRLRGSNLAARFGARVASGADILGDPIEDIAVCAPQATGNDGIQQVGALYLYAGRAGWGTWQGDAVDPEITLVGEGALCGALVVTEDHFGDVGSGVLVGDPEAGEGRGKVYLVRPADVVSNIGDIASESFVVLEGAAVGDGFGAAVVALNGLGIGGDAPDLVVGAPGVDGARGTVYLFDVMDIDLPVIGAELAQVTVQGSWGNSEFGKALVAGKGFAGSAGTVWIGAPAAGAMSPQAGAVVALNTPTLEALGPEIWTEEVPGLLLGDHADGHAGLHLGWGDMDGDGNPDVVITEPDYYHGSTYVLRSSTLVDEDGDQWVAPLADCDDGADWIFPFAPEECDALDSNCDGDIPDDEIDFDGDGWLECGDDCDPDDSAVNPAEEEVCDDGIDNNCDDLVDDQDPACGGSGDDDGADDDAGDDDAGLDDDEYPSGFRCECRLAPAGAPAGVAGLLALAAVLLLRRR